MLNAWAPMPRLPTKEQHLELASINPLRFRLLVTFLPARFLGEKHKVHIFRFVSFNELQARVVLPMSHGLSGQGFPIRAPVLINFIWDYPVIP